MMRKPDSRYRLSMSESSGSPEPKPESDVSAAKPAEAAKSAAGRNRSNKRRKSSGPPKPRERVAPGGPRHLARITAMQVLYEIDVADHSASEVLTRTFDDPDLTDEDEGPRVMPWPIFANGWNGWFAGSWKTTARSIHTSRRRRRPFPSP